MRDSENLRLEKVQEYLDKVWNILLWISCLKYKIESILNRITCSIAYTATPRKLDIVGVFECL